MQDKSTITEPKLLYYTKNMPTTVLNNICIPIYLFSRAKYQVIGIVLDGNSISNFQSIHNLANDCSVMTWSWSYISRHVT